MYETPTSDTIQHLLASLTQQHPWQLEALDAGKISKTWHVTHAEQDYILRTMPPDSQDPCTYPEEMFLLNQLTTQGLPVPRPIAYSAKDNITDIAFEWSLISVRDGDLLYDHHTGETIARGIGTLMAKYHQTPIGDGFGRIQIRNGLIIGSETTPINGACSRWINLPMYPLDDSQLEDHLVASIFPALVGEIELLSGKLYDAANDSQRVLCHSDLNGKNLLVKGDLITGLIDFGDACLLPPAWDIALFCFYHGWSLIHPLLEAYTASSDRQQSLKQQAYRLGVIIMLNKMEKRVRFQPDYDFQQDLPKLRKILDFIQHGA